jgi:hypothetical protein
MYLNFSYCNLVTTDYFLVYYLTIYVEPFIIQKCFLHFVSPSLLVIYISHSFLLYIGVIFIFLHLSLSFLVLEFQIKNMIIQFSHSNYIDIYEVLSPHSCFLFQYETIGLFSFNFSLLDCL